MGMSANIHRPSEFAAEYIEPNTSRGTDGYYVLQITDRDGNDVNVFLAPESKVALEETLDLTTETSGRIKGLVDSNMVRGYRVPA